MENPMGKSHGDPRDAGDPLESETGTDVFGA